MKKYALSDWIATIGMIVILFGLSISFFLLPDTAISEDENRALAQAPALSSSTEGSILDRIRNGTFLDRLFDGSYAADVKTYFSDQFPLRSQFVELKSSFEMLLGKQENNGVLRADGGMLIDTSNPDPETNLEKNCSSIRAFSEKVDVPVLFAVAGRKSDVLTDAFPATYPTERFDAPWAEISAPYLDLRATLRPHADEVVYYKTDHHWTTLGAYYAYCDVSSALGKEPYALDTFTVTEAADDFVGTTASSFGSFGSTTDVMEYYRFEGDEDYTTSIVSTGVSFPGFYNRAYLEVKDKYSSFLSGNNALVTVTKNGENDRETLLLVKDSFAHATAPFLARHYDLVIVDPRYYMSAPAALIAQYEADAALILCNMDTLLTSSDFVKLRFGLPS